MFFDDVDIVVQGPLHKHGLEAIPTYASFGNVIVSCWKDDDCELVRRVSESPNVSAVVLSDPHVPSDICNVQNRYLHVKSTLAGLHASRSDTVVKIRCDESYSDLLPIIVPAREGLIATHNVFFRPDNVHKFHPSDHVIGAKCDEFVRGWESVFKIICEGDESTKEGGRILIQSKS